MVIDKINSWLRKFYNKSIHGIGFYPAMLSALFLISFIALYNAEQSEAASFLKDKFVWLNLKHTEAARTILTTITAGVIGLTVFSFSMVMVVMSQAASQLSNRLIDHFIGNKFQQTILGFYLGTIISSFFLLSVVDDKGSAGIPSLSVFILVIVTIMDLFLFVSFLHFITKSIRFEQLIKSIHQKTISSLEHFTPDPIHPSLWNTGKRRSIEIQSPVSSYFQGVNRKLILKFCQENDLMIEFHLYRCSFILEHQPLLTLYCNQPPGKEKLKHLFESIDFYSGQEIDKNPYYGFLHLSEVAIKALSPGVNDPNTAVLCIHALTDLLVKKMHQTPSLIFCDREATPRMLLKERSFEEVFNQCVYPIWDYGKKDRFVRNAFLQMLEQLMLMDRTNSFKHIFDNFKNVMNKP